MGIHSSYSTEEEDHGLGNSNCSGMTPMTAKLSPLIVTRLPMMSGAAPYWRLQSRSLRIATR